GRRGRGGANAQREGAGPRTGRPAAVAEEPPPPVSRRAAAGDPAVVGGPVDRPGAVVAAGVVARPRVHEDEDVVAEGAPDGPPAAADEPRERVAGLGRPVDEVGVEVDRALGRERLPVDDEAEVEVRALGP